MPAFGSERAWFEPNPLKRLWLRWWGWRQIGPRIRWGHMQRAIGDAPPRRVLEAGCGWGQNLFALRRRFPEAQLVGVDCDAAALAEAQRMAVHLAGPPVEFVQERLPALAVDGAFDMILMVDVLEYIEEDAVVLRRLRALLAPGGRLLLHVPRRISQQRRVLPVSHDIPGHARPEYTRDEIVALVQSSGFRVTRIRPTFGWWGTVAWEAGRFCEHWRSLAALTYPALLLLAWLDVLAAPRDGNGYLVIAQPQAA